MMLNRVEDLKIVPARNCANNITGMNPTQATIAKFRQKRYLRHAL